MLGFANPLTPRDAKDVLSAVRDAVDTRRPLEVFGHGTKRRVGRAVAARQMLDLSKLAGVIFYDPEEIVLSVHAGTPLAEIDALLGAKNQELAFEPMDYGPLFGAPRDGGTIGGALAANIAGPRRIKSGAARDHVLGVNAVSGRGEAFKSGGRVVKNVTGYDLSKGMAGSWGTLAVLTDVTFKVLPRAETSSTFAIFGLDDRAAIDVLCRAMGSSAEVSGAVHLPARLAPSFTQLSSYGFACTLLRLEGFRPSVLYRAQRLAELVGKGRESIRIDDTDSADLWRAIRDVEPFADREDPLWRISCAPSRAPDIVRALSSTLRFRHYYDWSGGLVWLELGETPQDCGASKIRKAIRENGGGHATLIRAPEPAPEIAHFHPQSDALAALSSRLKQSFDPLGILNPGRMG
ncbi:2-hydroxy-acid oxidase [Terrihabitans soli]|uniref:2-hydroxy-acid oxidase n=1 Tax=Terrihabitans soli TaxID=708113 RepID=A0A6S6QWF7_9HYPH|nr:glycolate oxidase subunit GlcE [Terrihabitans soli]BCJ92257.1 2-hydroxy-acid oxidase [Terrihabitans soli]